ncbi:MAG: hypothetical protein CME59_00900 [Halioglobus sp.]|nr:hypothetical protein [Halioglobus sp.]|tara:strand:+ start:2250 stop:2573 length:324 start_codon:yes stop_codon:yes gene_type:complete
MNPAERLALIYAFLASASMHSQSLNSQLLDNLPTSSLDSVLMSATDRSQDCEAKVQAQRGDERRARWLLASGCALQGVPLAQPAHDPLLAVDERPLPVHSGARTSSF